MLQTGSVVHQATTFPGRVTIVPYSHITRSTWNVFQYAHYATTDKLGTCTQLELLGSELIPSRGSKNKRLLRVLQ